MKCSHGKIFRPLTEIPIGKTEISVTEPAQPALSYEHIKGFKPGFHIIAPVATVVAVVEKRVLTQKYFLSDASDTVFPYDRRCRSISLELGRGDLGSITNI